ncbi:exonuclease V, partial [Tremellales sp. Uapishka_1]
MDDDDDFDDVFEYDEDLEKAIQNIESQGVIAETPATLDIEDLPMIRLSPFAQFRKKGFLSVSDLVGTVWCEVQYDYRLRTLPYLPPNQRPAVITSTKGKEIVVDQIKVEGKEKVLRRGEKIHKRLEREIHPLEIRVTAETREDVWGLRFLNMLSALEALITLGKCRELPVVGFLNGIMVMGIIDEITREVLPEVASSATARKQSLRQTSISDHFLSMKPKAGVERIRTHKLYVTDSKTRANGTLPRESDTLAGRLQVMMYKELLDAILLSGHSEGSTSSLLPSENAFSFKAVFEHLGLDDQVAFSEGFTTQSQPIIEGNGLRFGCREAKRLDDMAAVWQHYVEQLGLGTPVAASAKGEKKNDVANNFGRTENVLALVYRRAGPLKKYGNAKDGRSDKRRSKRKRKGEDSEPALVLSTPDEDERLLQRAIAESLKQPSTDTPIPILEPPESQDLSCPASPTHDGGTYWFQKGSSSDEREEEELAWAVEMSLGGTDRMTGTTEETTLMISQSTQPTSLPDSGGNKEEVPEKPGTTSGSIIGKHKFTHSPSLLVNHLDSVLKFWMGERDPLGVKVEDASRCAWCEFEEDCEWRMKKAEEAMKKRKGGGA